LDFFAIIYIFGRITMKKSKRQLTRRIAAGLTASVLLTVSPAFAEEASGSQEFMLDQIVITANRMPIKLSETAANATIITREEIEMKHYETLGQALRSVNGVDVTSHGHPGAQSIVRLNGNDRVVILIDGRRVNWDKGSGNGRAGYELNSLPSMANVERIEIVKGAASALYGTDAVGGVINIITRKGAEGKSTLDLSAGSWGGRNYQFSNQGANGDWSWFLTAGRQEQDYFSYKDFTDGKTKKMDNSAFTKDSLTFRLDKAIDDARSVTLQVEHATDKSGQPGMVPGRTWWGRPQHFPNDSRTTLTNNYAITYNFNKDTENAGYLRFYENYITRTNDTSIDGITSFDNKTQGLDWQKSWRLDDNNLLVGGMEWRKTKVDSPSVYAGRHSIDNTAIYLENRMSLNDKWTLTPGLRYDKHNMFGNETTPRVSVNYKIDDTANAYISWGKVFNAPSTDDLYWSQPDRWMMGNPNLQPETGETTTIGVNKKLSDKTQVTASYFHSKLEDAIDWDDDGTGIYKPFNVDNQRSDGFEIEVRTELSPNWNLSGAYSYLKVEDKDAGATAYTRNLKNNQPNGYRLGLDYSKDALAVNLAARGASGRSTEHFTASSYWVMDTTIKYKLSESTRAYFNIYNLTDKAYETVSTDASYGGPGGYPMSGRFYQFGVQYNF
jgi:vitamin B12 transporter